MDPFQSKTGCLAAKESVGCALFALLFYHMRGNGNVWKNSRSDVAKQTKVSDNKDKADRGEQSVFNADKYDMPEQKIREYLLKPGAKHSKEFFDVGYTEHDTERLNNDIHAQFDESKAIDKKVFSNGSVRFSIMMELGIDKKRTFRTVWQKEKDSEKARFITSHREGKKNV